jgi:Zn-dependent peptidase ImmA (M78 family)
LVKLVRDTLHGLGERPHYEGRELDAMFEKLVSDFLKKKHGKVALPIDTEDIKSLIEEDVDDLDQYADLSAYGPTVEGLTEFRRGQKPRVKISENVHKYENRLRTTLTHEYGHVRLHAYLFGLENFQLGMAQNSKPNTIYCKRETILAAGQRDWMEWQAGYACGAVLMPRNALKTCVGEVQRGRGIYGAVESGSADGQALIDAVVQAFAVSRDAARVRLSIFGHLGARSATNSLFG